MRYCELSQDLQVEFDNVLDSTSLPHWMEIKVIDDIKLKTDLYQVKKANDLISFFADSDVNIVIVVSEDTLYELPIEYRALAFEEMLTGISVDENDRIKISSPDISTFSGMLVKHGNEKVIQLKESVKSIFQQRDEKEKQEKASAKLVKKKN